MPNENPGQMFWGRAVLRALRASWRGLRGSPQRFGRRRLARIVYYRFTTLAAVWAYRLLAGKDT
jgi:hypothetical protein